MDNVIGGQVSPDGKSSRPRNVYTVQLDDAVSIVVHRGIDQIGGCITEISTGTSRVFVDFGQNLPDCAEPSTPEQDRAMVNEIFGRNVKPHQAVIYTHAHDDHVGLFDLIPADVPQYIGKGGKELLITKYGLMLDAHKRYPKDADSDVDTVSEDVRKLRITKYFRTWKRPKPNIQPQTFTVGDICVTPFRSCHSIYDSYMFLIQAAGKRIWHTGDYREHGYLGKNLYSTLEQYATDIDVLITEGTTLKRGDECIQESEVSERMAHAMSSYKYVVVLASATDIERLATIKNAAAQAHKDLYITGAMLSRTMSIFTHREARASGGLFEFHPQYVREQDECIAKMRNAGFVLISGTSQLNFVRTLCGGLPSSDVLLIYSAWDGYYKDPSQVKRNPAFKAFRDAFSNVVDIHTSGHASRSTIEKVVKIVNPRHVICIHREPGAEI